MVQLTLSLFGPFQATLDGVPVTGFESDKVRALLAYLAVEHSRPQRREMLAGLLWPDMAERDARTNLRHVLANLRKAIGDRDADQPFLLTSRQTLQFNVESDYDLDVKTFADTIAATATHPHAALEDCDACIARLHEAAKLYNGDFLTGFSLNSDLFETWITTWRERKIISHQDGFFLHLINLLIGGAGGFILGHQRSTGPSLPKNADLGMQYHTWSKPGIPNPLAAVPDWGQRLAQYKSYPDAPHVSLPAPGDARGLTLEDAIRQRRSIRAYDAAPMTLDALSRLLFHADSINAERGGTRLRAAPSAGALYPIETYVIAHRVDDLEPGLYHYAVQDHTFARLHTGNLRNEIVCAGLMQGFLGEANIVLVLTAMFQRPRWKYRERTYRYAMLEAGHIGQNVYLAAASMGMGACAVGAFNDDAVNALVGVDGINEAALYLLAVEARLFQKNKHPRTDAHPRALLRKEV